MESLLKDLRYSLRLFARNRGFATIALLSLSLGIVATTTIFSVIYCVLLAPPLYKDPGSIVVLWESNAIKGMARTPVAPADFRDWRERSRSIEDMELVAPGSPVTVTGSELPQRANIQYATAGLFNLLGVHPALGRFFVGEEIKSIKPIMLSYDFWSQRFSRDPGVIGQQVTVNGDPETVVGVLPRDFHLFDQDTDLWFPIDRPNEDSRDRSFRSWLIAVGRLRRGETLRSAQTEMNLLAQRIASEHPETNKDWGVKLEPIQEAQFGYWKPILYLLFGIVAFALLISCANVANLLLGRLIARSRELCLRASLGASRSRIVRQMLTEGLLLGAMGGALACALAYGGIDLFRAMAPANFPLLQSVRINLPILLFCLSVSLLSGMAVSAGPALFASRLDLIQVLKSTTQSTVGGPYRRYRDTLVVAEIALSLALLFGAGLMINSLVRLLRVDPGFRPQRVVTMQMFLAGPKYFEFGNDGVNVHEGVGEFYRRLLECTGALPAVESAGLVSWLPEMGYNTGRRERAFRLIGQQSANGSGLPTAPFNSVSSGYFKTLQIPMLAGRSFDSRDDESAPWVAIVNKAFAQRYWPGADPVGKRLRVDGGPTEKEREIVGVVGDVRQNGLDAHPDPEIFVPYLQQPSVSSAHGYQNRVHMTLVVRTAMEPSAVITEIRRIAAEMDSSQPIYGARTMSETLSESTSLRRLYARLLELTAGIALLLSTIGIYGVISHSVAQRTNEIGLRIAIGAAAGDIFRLVFIQGGKLILAGLGLGMALALTLDRFLTSYLYGISAGDPATMTACCVLLSVIAFGAIWIPARRATRVDPIVTLRYE